MSEGETSRRTWQLALGLAVIVLFGLGLMLMQSGGRTVEDAPAEAPVGGVGGDSGSASGTDAAPGSGSGTEGVASPERSGALDDASGARDLPALDQETRDVAGADPSGDDTPSIAAVATINGTEAAPSDAAQGQDVAGLAADAQGSSGQNVVGQDAGQGDVAALAAPDEARPATPVATIPPSASPSPATGPAPSFDLVRIDAEGSATIAGQAPAGGTVVILLDGEEQARARIGGDGSFAALFDIPPGAQPRVMLLEVLLPDGTRQRSDQTIIITPPSEADPQVVAQADLTGVPVATLAQGAEVLARAADLPNAAGGAVGGGSVDATASVGGSPDLPEAPDGPQMSEALADEDGTAPDIEAAEARLQITELAPELAAEVDAAAVVDGDAVEVASVDLEAGEARPVTVPETVAVADAVARDATTDARPEAEVVDAGATDPVLSAAAQVEREPVDAGSTNAARPGDTGSGGANSSPASAVDVAAPQVSTTVSRAASQPAVATATPRAPSVLLQDRDGLRLLQPATPPATAVDAPTAPVALAVDAISYGAAGEVRLDGRGKVGSGDKVLVYLDNDLRGDVDLGADGRWSMELTDVVPGLYTLRADQIGADGAVSARFETPFQREAPEALADVLPAAATGDVPVTDVSAGEDVAADSGALSDRTEARETLTAQATDPARVAVTAITVQPGYTLWGIASDRYGDGFSYVKIFEANGGQIRDPDLIYPGQVFDLPK